ncbi:hypothetical protein [Xylanimonas ulmi]|uniref:Uncharacterized protein n=1 Tax=Xylanimonas ulmi TaxID=228973 RepID=A0A4Q7LZM2_9MICO|nr:hypothetical protein [Xylanibacterium ulmi]RZS60444.1 hypothetical protein EV386_0702 [Xylanibacterium ulmi]
MSDDVDETIAEIDLLAVADAVGVYKSGPVEMPSAEQWARPLPNHRPYDDRHVTEVRRLARRFEDAHRAERDERIGSAGKFNGDANADRHNFVNWLVERLNAAERRNRRIA